MENENRIRFFVSSTFEDMHDERDAIQMRVLPAVSRIAAKHGHNIDFCDLRWGINTQDCDESDKSDKVLKVCFDEIKKCRPYMIVMLGERYGSVPSEDAFVSVLLHMNNRGSEIRFSRDDIYEKSYTELEILYGPLSDEEILSRTLFLFREPIEGAPAHFRSVNDESREKMKRLKDSIRAKLKEKFGNDHHIITYSLSWKEGEHGGHVEGISEFSKMVEKQLTEMITPSFRIWDSYSDIQKKRRLQKAYAEKMAIDFCAFKQLARCEEKINSGIHKLRIYGPRETRLSLTAKLSLSCEEKGDLIFPVFNGADAVLSSVEDVTSFWCACIREYLIQNGNSDVTDDMNLDELLEIYFSVPSRPRLILMTDIYMEPYLKKHDRLLLIYAHASEYGYPKEERDTNDTGEISTELDKPSTEDILDAILRGLGKEIPFAIRSLILEKYGSQSYGYISKLVKRLIMIDGGDLREAAEKAKGLSLKGDAILLWLQKKLVEELPSTPEELSLYLWEEANQRLGREFITGILRYTALFRGGLRQRDLAGLLHAEGIRWDGAAYSVLIHYFSEMITETADGYTVYTDEREREEYRKTFDTKEYSRKFFNYIRSGEVSCEDELFTRYLIEVCALLEEREFFLSVCEGDYGSEAARTLAGKVLSSHNGFDWVYKAFEEKSTPYTEKDIVFLNRYIYENYEAGKHNVSRREKIIELSVSIAQKIRMEDHDLIDVYIKRAYLSKNKKELHQYLSMAAELMEKEDKACINYQSFGNIYIAIAEEYASYSTLTEHFLIAGDAIRKCLQNKDSILSHTYLYISKANFLYKLSDAVREYNKKYKELYDEAFDREEDLLRRKYKNPDRFFRDYVEGFDSSLRESLEAKTKAAMKEYELDGSPLEELRDALLREAMEQFIRTENCSWKWGEGDWIWKLSENLIFYTDKDSIPENIRRSVCEKVLLMIRDEGKNRRELYSEACLKYLLFEKDAVRAKEYISVGLNLYRDSELKAEVNYSRFDFVFSLCETMAKLGFDEEAYAVSLRLLDVLRSREINEMENRYSIRERLLRVYRFAQMTALRTGKYLQAWDFSDILAERLILFSAEWDEYYDEAKQFFREVRSSLCKELPMIFSKSHVYPIWRLRCTVRKLGFICDHAQSEYIMLSVESAKFCKDDVSETSEMILRDLDKSKWKEKWGISENLTKTWRAVASYAEIALKCGISVKKELSMLFAYLPQIKREHASEYMYCLQRYKKILKSSKESF